jgi:hypothetical protein
VLGCFFTYVVIVLATKFVLGLGFVEPRALNKQKAEMAFVNISKENQMFHEIY